MQPVRIRTASVQDARDLLGIYAPYVTDTAITFEYDVPTVEEFATRIGNTLKKYPYVVALAGKEIVGYAYAGHFQTRAAYQWAVETAIYVRRDGRRMGVGRRLYDALEQALRAQGILNMNACIAYPCAEDAYLTRDSVLFHERLGYRLVGQFQACGYKFDRWYDMVWMEKHIGAHVSPQAPVKRFDEVRGALEAAWQAEERP